MAKKKMTLEEKLEEAVVKDAPYEVPGNWVWIKYKYLTKETKLGLVRGSKEQSIDKKYKYLKMNNITKGGELDLNNVINVDASDTEVDNYSLQIDDFLFNTRNSRELVGKNTVVKHYFNEHILFNNNIMRVRFSSIANPRIISYYLNSPLGNSKLEEIKKVTTNVAAIYAKDLNNIFIPIPPLKEQQRIVDKIESLFGKLDNAKELIEEAREDFEKRKSAILEKAFRGELTKEWRNINSKYNAFSELESIKENNDRKYQMTENSNAKFEIPKSWIWTNLGELTDLLSDYHSNGSYKVLKEKVELLDEPNYACMIRTTNFEKDNFTDLMKYITKDAYEHLSKSKLFGEEILINKIGNAGSVYFMPTLGRPASLAMNLFMLRISEYISSKYIYYHLKSIYSTSDINQFVRGITTKTIDKKSINSLNIALPPLEEQKEIVRILDNFLEKESKIEELTALEEKIELIKKSILAKAFRGQLGTNCEEDESALELLKEILMEK